MRILVINRFFGGDQVPTGRMLEDVTCALAAEGHDVIAVVSRGGYVTGHDNRDHQMQNVRLVRLLKLPFGGRALDWVTFWIQAAIVGPLLRWDRCILLTDPPLMTVFLPFWRLIGRRRRSIWLWTMDLYPEALVASEVIRDQGFLERLLRRLNNSGLVQVHEVIALGDRQLERLRNYSSLDKNQKNITVVPPWDHRSLAVQKDASKGFAEKAGWQGNRVALYAGNLGYGHRFEEIIDAARAAYKAELDWVFAFFVRGARKKALIESARGLQNVEVHDYVPPEETPALLCAADIHLVTMAAGWDGVVVPSKLYGIEKTGAPVLFVGPESADTAREIQARRMGETVGLGVSGKAMVDAMERAVACNNLGYQRHAHTDRQGPENPAEKIARLVTS